MGRRGLSGWEQKHKGTPLLSTRPSLPQVSPPCPDFPLVPPEAPSHPLLPSSGPPSGRILAAPGKGRTAPGLLGSHAPGDVDLGSVGRPPRQPVLAALTWLLNQSR